MVLLGHRIYRAVIITAKISNYITVTQYSLMSKSTLALSTAEVKLLLLFFHYIFLDVIFFVYFAKTLRIFDKLRKELVMYFMCESRGHDADNPCSRSGYESLIDPGLTAITMFSSV